MNELQKARFLLLSMANGNVDEARRMNDFVFGEKSNAELKSESQQNGVYIIYEDGNSEKFNGENSKENVKYVGIVNNGHSFAVALKDVSDDEVHLIPYDKNWGDNIKNSKPEYHKKEIQAIDDYDSEGNTIRLKEQGCKIELSDGEFIPAIGCLCDMFRFKNELNSALVYVGGTPLKNGWYWSSSEESANFLWYMDFTSSNVSIEAKYNPDYVRAVAEFNH